MKELVLATTNSGKFDFFIQYLNKYDISLLSLADFPDTPEVDEPYATAEENATHKAEQYVDLLGKDVLAVDIAMYTEALPEDQQPGVHIRRLHDRKTRMTDQEIYDYWVEKLKEHGGHPKGHWHLAFALQTTDGNRIEDHFDRHFVMRLDKATTYIEGLPLGGLCYNVETGKMHSEMTDEDVLVTYRGLGEMFERIMNQYLDV